MARIKGVEVISWARRDINFRCYNQLEMRRRICHKQVEQRPAWYHKILRREWLVGTP